MFKPKQHVALEPAPQEHRLLWLSVPRAPGAVAAGMQRTAHIGECCLGPPPPGTDPTLWVPSSPLAPLRGPRWQMERAASEQSLKPEG